MKFLRHLDKNVGQPSRLPLLKKAGGTSAPRSCLWKASVVGAVFSLLPLASTLHAQAVWNVATGSFSVGSNWTGNGGNPPNSGVSALINNGGTSTVLSNASSGGITVGNSNSGTLTVDALFGTASLSNTGNAIVGNQASSNGTVNVLDGTWSNTGSMQVGVSGTGTLNITSNGGGVLESVSNTTGIIGVNAGSNGTVTVDGGVWNNSSTLHVGENGTGTLTIKTGGQVQSTGQGMVGFQSGSGTVTIDGTGSKWVLSGVGNSLFVGYNNNSSGQLEIKNGGEAQSSSGAIGLLAGSTGTVVIDGLNSKWTNSGGFSIGNSGTGTLTLSNGGQLNTGVTTTLNLAGAAGSNGTINIGNGAGAGTLIAKEVRGVGGTAQINFNHNELAYTFAPIISGTTSVKHMGTGTTILGTSSTYTGDTTVDGGTLVIQNGVTISNTAGHIGQGMNSNGTVIVDGAGSTWTNTGALDVLHGTLNITNGGTTIASSFAYMGNPSNLPSVVTVDGANSTFNVFDLNVNFSSTLNVSNMGAINDTFSLAITTYSTINISNGGKVTSDSGVIGGSLALQGGTCIIDGADSQWTTNTMSIISASFSNLTLQNGGQLNIAGGSGILSLGQNGILNMGNGGLAGTILAAEIKNYVGTSGKVVFNHNEAAYHFIPTITGGASVEIKGGGTTILSTNNTYTGNTTVSNGTLLANNVSGSATGTGNVYVEALGTLGGTGIIDGDTTIYGHLKPGALLDPLHFNKNLTLDINSNTHMEIAKLLFPQSTNIEVDGNIFFDGALDVDFVGGNDLAYGDSFQLFTFNPGFSSGTFSQEILPGFNDPNLFWDISDLYTTGIITVVPEPSTWTLMVFGLIGIFACGSFYRRQRV